MWFGGGDSKYGLQQLGVMENSYPPPDFEVREIPSEQQF